MRSLFNYNSKEKTIENLTKSSNSNNYTKINPKKKYSMLSNKVASLIPGSKKKKSKDLKSSEVSALSNFKLIKQSSRNNYKNKRVSTSSSLFQISHINNKNLTNINEHKINSSVNLNNEDYIIKLSQNNKIKNKFLDIKKPYELYINKISKTPKNYNYKGIYSIYYAKDLFKPKKNNKVELVNNEGKTNFSSYYYYYKNDKKFFKIKENISNEISSKELKKKICLMKKSIIQSHSSKDLQNIIYGNEEIPEAKIVENNRNVKNNINENNDESQICLKNATKFENNEEKNKEINNRDKYRNIKRIKELYDSFDDEEYEDDEHKEIYISPNSIFIKIFDIIIFLCSLFYLIVVPFLFSRNIILSEENKICKLFLIMIDLIYIFDIILNCFRPYQNFDENLVIKTKYIFLHYIKTWFFIDFIQCFPFFTTFQYLEKVCIKNHYKDYDLDRSGYNIINPILYIIILVKIIKIYKLFNNSIIISNIQEILSKNEILDYYGNFIFSVFISFCFLNLCACLFIFIGKNSYPNWIIKMGFQDESYISIYIASIYFILVTITTVGYGDISGNSEAEIFFQMFLLIIGTIAYSFVISYFSNYIIKINQKSMKFQKNVSILEEIRLNNPLLKDSVYQEVLKNLHNEQLYESKDKSLLFDCLPYSLKNKLIMEMYKPFIDNFIFFKDIENSDFIVKVITSLKPLLSFKCDVLVQEGDFINEIFFVKKGSLCLSIAVNKETPEESIRKYLGVNENGKINISITPSLMNSYKRNSVFNLDDKCDYLINKKKEDIVVDNELNLKEIKLLEIRQNEHFGVSLMFLNERSPLSVKVKTKIAELLILKKMEAIEIHSIYPNIWKRINKKSLYNLEQIKLKIKQELFSIATKYGSITKKNILNKSKSLKKFINTSFGKTNESQVEMDKAKNIKLINSEKKDKKRKTKKNINKPKQNNNINKLNRDESKKEEEKKEDINNERKIESNNNSILKNSINKEILNDSIVQNKKINKLDSINKNKSKIISSKKFNDKDNINNSNKIYLEKELKDFTKNDEKELMELNNSILNTLNSNKNMKKDLMNSKKYSNIDKILYSLPTKLNHENFIDNESMICNDSNIITQIFQESVINEIEKKINYFSNLTTTNINSFQLNSSYENINEITNNKYIGDNFLQAKTKQFLLKEFSIINNDSQNKNNNNNILLLKNQFYKKMNKSYRKDNCNYNNQFNLESDKNNINSLGISNLKSTKNINININASEKNKDEKLVRGKYESFKKLISRNQSINNNLNSPSSKYKCKSPKKRKNDSLGFNKKLNIISKNIKGANKNINNPNEFYMDFFNNIIKQENFDNFKIDIKNNHITDNKREKNNKLEISKTISIKTKKFRNSNFYSGESKEDNTKINRKSTKKF